MSHLSDVLLHPQSRIGFFWFLLVALLRSHGHSFLAARNEKKATVMAGALTGWVQATIAGFRAMAASDAAKVAGHWLAARDALIEAAAEDPRRAAGQTNAGAGYVLLRRRDDAERTLADAERRWMHLLAATTTGDVPVSGRSSAFHFRLASTNLAAFQNAQRLRLSRLCEAGLAITRFNRLLASDGTSASAAVAPAVASQLTDLLGPRAPEVRLLLSTPGPASEVPDAHAIYADKVATLDARRTTMAEPAADDWQLLEVAVALTALLPPGLPFDAGDALRQPSDPHQIKSSSTR